MSRSRPKKGAPQVTDNDVADPTESIFKFSEINAELMTFIETKISSAVHEIIERLDKKDEIISRIQRDMVQLRDENSQLRKRLEDVEAHQRRKTLIISGENLPVLYPVKTPHRLYVTSSIASSATNSHLTQLLRLIVSVGNLLHKILTGEISFLNYIQMT